MQNKIILIPLCLVLFFSTAMPTYAVGVRQDKLLKVREQKIGVLQELALKNKQVAQLLSKIDDLENKVEHVTEEMAPLQKEYLIAEREAERVEKLFKHRVRALYQKGESNLFTQFLSARSLSEAIFRYEIIRNITKQDKQLLTEHELTVAKVKQKKQIYDNKIQEAQMEIEKIMNLRKELLQVVKAQNNQLLSIREYELEHHHELIKIHLAELKSGRLKFPYVGSMKVPVKGANLTSGYGFRYRPRAQFHSGIDFAAPIGTPVIAPAAGVVVESRPSAGYGWLITIYHGNKGKKRIYTRYAHSYPYQIRVRIGQQVYQGDIITAIGSNGDSSGPHLHFEVKVGRGDNPPFTNPIYWLADL